MAVLHLNGMSSTLSYVLNDYILKYRSTKDAFTTAKHLRMVLSIIYMMVMSVKDIKHDISTLFSIIGSLCR